MTKPLSVPFKIGHHFVMTKVITESIPKPASGARVKRVPEQGQPGHGENDDD
jgi:hypothetical protein